ncbi:LuxR C-terminal-related transcriptional regulator [Kitasatospora sp. MAP5-34]|uniref:LuxR C-terminal-related transcriptional regulator n=1 Tax=Kitasatospora sp. MAP5-34 TaxID=3035102 RepID=UPI0024761E2D|nr:LuxR C-terminal-related transcriptional regulator [Kitasatospora sp. MAP5-34]MDH6580400.1 sugar-specific transcriptional regulator TrmB [Kitasatospora sp. MAP5-34]
MAADLLTGRDTSLPDEAARQLYLAILARGGRLPFYEVTRADHHSISQLVGMGLLLANQVDSVYTVVSPRGLVSQVSAELRSEATRLLLRAEELPGTLDGLTKAYDSAHRRAEQGGEETRIEGYQNIQHRIVELLSDCREEALAAQPGRRPADVMDQAASQGMPLLERGGRIRTLYQPVTLQQPATVRCAAEVTAHGAQVRILDEPFERMMIFDRSTAVVATAGDHSQALFTTEPATVAFMVAVFQRDWARADAVQWGAPDPQGDGPSVADRVSRLLATGLTQRGVASRLGLSERTVAAHISRLRDRYGAQTLFQLGWLMRGGRRD